MRMGVSVEIFFFYYNEFQLFLFYENGTITNLMLPHTICIKSTHTIHRLRRETDEFKLIKQITNCVDLVIINFSLLISFKFNNFNYYLMELKSQKC